jgi:hypothetical protein
MTPSADAAEPITPFTRLYVALCSCMALTELNEGYDDNCHRQQCRQIQHDVGWLLWTVWISLFHIMTKKQLVYLCNHLDEGQGFRRNHYTLHKI